jgi:PKHD-type hydroxylase
MKGEWCYWNYAFTVEECNQIIELCKNLPEQLATIGINSQIPQDLQKLTDAYRKSIVRWIDNTTNPEFDWVYDKIWNVTNRTNRDWFHFNITTLPPMQFTEYDENYKGEYKMHQDVFWLTNTNRHRKLSTIIQLTDESSYVGGDLKFHQLTGSLPTEQDYANMRKIGTAITFPSFINHQLEPVTKGTRYSLVAWFEGPKFQ